MKVKPDLSFWKLWNISFGFFGVQIAYALQSANISRIFSTLGADPHSLSYFWILPPLAGIIVQPIVGAASDKTWTRFGRRIPYLFIGSLVAVLVMCLLPNAGSFGMAVSTAMIFGLVSLMFLDTSINMAMQPFKMMVGDMVMKNEKTWYPNATLDDADHFWDSGNEGASIASRNPTAPETGDVVKDRAVRMASDYISIASKFAAGNIYTGDFVGLAGIEGAELDFGQPYTGRPSALKGYYKYTPGVIDQAKAPYDALMGQTDSCHIYIGLFDWSAPFRVNTTTGTFVDLTWNNESMIAFGELKSNEATGSEYKQFKINLTYRDYFTRPKYILIVASASKYGDYFTGSTSSVMYLDECELVFE